MSWVLEHLQLIIVVGGAIAYWLNQRQRQKRGESADYDGDGIPEVRELPPLKRTEAAQSEEAERTRRIQEEIKRKILERRGGAAPTAPTLPEFRPATPPAVERRGQPQPQPPPLVQSPSRRVQGRNAAALEAEKEELEHQRKLAEQLEILRKRRAEEHCQQQAAYDVQAMPGQGAILPSALPVPANLLAELRNPQNVRRAIILREVLGTPVGLR